MGHYAKAYPIFSRIRGYRRFTNMLHSLRRFGKDEIAVQRVKDYFYNAIDAKLKFALTLRYKQLTYN